MKFGHCLIVLVVTIIGFGLTNAFKWYTLEDWSYIATIVTALSVGLAAGTFIYQKGRDKALSVSEQLQSFITVIIPALEDLAAYIRDKSPDYNFPRFERIEQFTPGGLIRNNRHVTQLQNDLNVSLQQTREKNIEVSLLRNKLFNSLEGLSIKIQINKTIDEEGFISIHNSFVQIVEQFALALIFSSPNPYDPNLFPGIKYVYSQWMSKVDRTAFETNRDRFDAELDEALNSRPE